MPDLAEALSPQAALPHLAPTLTLPYRSRPFSGLADPALPCPVLPLPCPVVPVLLPCPVPFPGYDTDLNFPTLRLLRNPCLYCPILLCLVPPCSSPSWPP